MANEISEPVRKVPNDSEDFGMVRNGAEGFGSVRKSSDRKENHTLTVREVARMFEKAGVARTERSIINWCQPSKLGVPRLDCYFDPNEHKYFITGQSVELAIKEEQARAKQPAVGTESETLGNVPKGTEQSSRQQLSEDRTGSLEQEIMDLRIMNKGKDFLIEQMRNEREEFFSDLMQANRRVGELETRLLQISASADTATGNESRS